MRKKNSASGDKPAAKPEQKPDADTPQQDTPQQDTPQEQPSLPEEPVARPEQGPPIPPQEQTRGIP